uniref:Transposase n=1 Tax=Bursaphelenchus xylophilus TaxID=6326 RepID=A0A1I7SU05_BURXY
MIKTAWARIQQPITLPCGVETDPEATKVSLEWRKDAVLIYNVFGNETGNAAPNMQAGPIPLPVLLAKAHGLRKAKRIGRDQNDLLGTDHFLSGAFARLLLPFPIARSPINMVY